MNSLTKLVNRNLVLSIERTTCVALFPRFLTCTNVIWKGSQKNEILRKLNIPERPKRPIRGYLRFVKEFFPSQKKSGKPAKEVISLAAIEWKKFDDSQKQRYNQEFEREMAAYSRKLAAYEKCLTPDKKLAIKDAQIHLKDLKEERMERKNILNLAKENGKPNRPPNAFLLFFEDERSKGKTNIKQTSANYNLLSESQKSAYTQKAKDLYDEYKKSLAAWEKEMISKGLTNIVRKSARKPTKDINK
ncbi:transcription factor A, mitochondrial-like [Contarinia nasturtii]|uniref:transcription factor A, mitochondrial-like n=1 Tax=Contarinia nasturtii TaxID=265458 RepID=UPI0012D46AB8|nr:transcription factor A, mitochondrial-like [Contarinia nasturtii]